MRGFTLIELMVVIAIVAILAAVSTGAYKTYLIKVKVNNAISLLDIYMDEAIKEYELTGEFPTSYTVNGVTVPHCAWTYVDFDEANTAWFSYCNNANGVTFTNVVSNLEGIPGYVAPTNGAHGEKVYFSRSFRFENNATYTTECGLLSAAMSDVAIPFQYLPGNCQCANVASWGSGGSC